MKIVVHHLEYNRFPTTWMKKIFHCEKMDLTSLSTEVWLIPGQISKLCYDNLNNVFNI
jgi:hypothetical protein